MKPVMLQNLLDKVLDRSFQQQQQMPQQQQPQSQQHQQQHLLLRVAGTAAPTRSDHGNSGNDSFAMKGDHGLIAAAAAESLDQQQRQHQQQLLLQRGGSSQRLAVEHAQNAKALQQQQQHYLLQQAAAVQQQQQQQAAAAAAAAFGRQALNSRTSGGEPGMRSSPYGISGPQVHQQLQQQQQQLLLPGMGPQHALSAAHHLAATAPVLGTIHHAGMPAAFGYDQLMAVRQPSTRGSIVTGLSQPQPMPSLVSPPGSQQQQPYSLRRSPAGMPSEMPSPRQTNASRATSHSPAQVAHGSGDVSLDHHQQQQRSAATAAATAWQQQQRRAADARDPPAISPSSHGSAEPVLRHVAYDQRMPGPGYGPLPVGAHGEMLLLSPPNHQPQQQRGPTHLLPPDAPTRGGPEALHVASSSSSSPPSFVARPAGSVAFVAMPRPNAFKGFHVTNGNVMGASLPTGALPSAGHGSHVAGLQPGAQQQRLGLPVQSQGLRAFGGPSHDGVVGYSSSMTGDEQSYRRRMDVDGLAPASWHRPERSDSPSREAAAIAAVTSGLAPAKSPAGALLPGSSGAPPAHSPTASGALHRQQSAAQPQRRSTSASPSPTSSAAAAIGDASSQQQQQLPIFLHPSSSAAMNAMHQQQQQQQLLLMHGGMAQFAAPYAVAMQRLPSQLQQTTQQHSAAPAASRRLPGSGAGAAEVSGAPQRQQQQALSATASPAEFAAQLRRTSPPSPAVSGSVYRQSPLSLHAPARHAAVAASADSGSSSAGFGASVASSPAASRSRSPRGPQQCPSAADEAQPLDLSARPMARPSSSEALLSASPGDEDDSSQTAAGDVLSYSCRDSAPDDDQPLDLTVSKASPRPPLPMLSNRVDHEPTSLLPTAAPEKDPRSQLHLLAGGNRTPVDGSSLAAVRGPLLSQGGGRPALGVYAGSLVASPSDAPADAAALGVTSPVTQPSPQRPAATLTAYVPGVHSSAAAAPLLHRNNAARYGSGSLVSHDTHPLVLDAVAASIASVRAATLSTMSQPLQLTAAAVTAVAAIGNATQGFGATIGSGTAGCPPVTGGSDAAPIALDGSRSSGLVTTSSRDVPSSANAGLSPLGQGQPQPPLSSSVTSLIGNHPLSDILFLHCTRCQSSYGSVHGFRKHFRNAHGHNPIADDVQVQSISATRELVRRHRDAGTAAYSSDRSQQLPQQAATPLLVGVKQPPLAFGARAGDAAQHASEQQSQVAAHDRAATDRQASWEEGGSGSSSATGISCATGRGGSSSSSSLLAEEQQQLHVDGSDSRQSPLLQQQQQLGALSADRFCLHCLYCGRQYPNAEGIAFEEHVLQHERQLSGGGAQLQPIHHQQQQHRDVHTYRCYYCGERAADAGALREHLLQHDELMHFVCSHCAVAYPTAAAASEHASACHRHHQGLLRCPSTSTASRSPLGEEVPPSADFSSGSDSGSSGRPTDDLELVSRLPVARSLQPPNGLAAYTRSRPDASQLFAVTAQPLSREARGTSKQQQQLLQAVARVRHPSEPHWDAAAAGQQSPATAVPGRSPDSDPSSQSSSPLLRREPVISTAEQLLPPEADGIAPFGTAGAPKYAAAGSRRSRAPYTLAQHIEAAVIRELSKASDGSDDATGGSRAEAVVRAAAGVELDQLLLHQQQTTGRTGPTATTAAASTGTGAGQTTVASLTPYSGGSSGGGGSTTVNLMAILDRVVEHGLRSFDTSCTAAVADGGTGGIGVAADAVALTQEAAAGATLNNDDHGSRGAMHVSSPALWMQNVSNGHRGASPERLATSFPLRAAFTSSDSSGGYGRGSSNDRRENKNDDRHNLATLAENTFDPSLCEASNGPTFSNGSTERADDDSGDEASALDSALTEPPTDSSQQSLSRDVDSAVGSVEQTDPTGHRRLASPPPNHHSLPKVAVLRQDASVAASPAPADESAGKSSNCLLVGTENLSCSLPRVDSQECPTPRPMHAISSAAAGGHVDGNASVAEGSSNNGSGSAKLQVDDDGRRDSTATVTTDVEAERNRSVADDRSSADLAGGANRESPTTESRFPALRVEASLATPGTSMPSVLAASGFAEDGDDDDATESQLGGRLLIDEERSCDDDTDHYSGAAENVEGPAGAAAAAAAADSSASAAEADDAVPPAPKIARLALPE